jgi:hypothetical protein
VKGFILGSTFKVTVTLAANIGFVLESSAKKTESSGTAMFGKCLDLKQKVRSKLNTKNVTVLGTEYQLCVRQT